MIYCNSDFERFFIRFKAEAAPIDESIEKFRVMVDICMSNGVHIQQCNLNYDGLKQLEALY